MRKISKKGYCRVAIIKKRNIFFFNNTDTKVICGFSSKLITNTTQQSLQFVQSQQKKTLEESAYFVQSSHEDITKICTFCSKFNNKDTMGNLCIMFRVSKKNNNNKSTRKISVYCSKSAQMTPQQFGHLVKSSNKPIDCLRFFRFHQ